MKHFLTITNIQKDEKKSFTKEVRDYIEQKGGTCLCYYSSGNKERVEQIDPKQIPEGVECILVLGGDGTLDPCSEGSVSLEYSDVRSQSWNTWISL